MALEIFKLVGSIFVDNEKANESIGQTDKKAQGAGTSLANGVKTAAKWGAAIVGAAATATTAIASFTTQMADNADEVDKMSQRLGVSREAYQELDYVMSQSGVEVNSFQTGMKSLLKNMDAVTEGNKTAISNFDKLGVSVVDANDKMKDQETVLYDTIRAFQEMEDGSEKSRLAQELFGKQGQEILPMLNAQAGGFDELTQKAHELGLVMDDSVIDSGVSLHDTIDTLKRSFSAILMKLGGTLMPMVEKIANFIIDHMPQIQSMFQKLEPVLTTLFEELMPPLLDLAEQIFPMLADLLAELMPIVIELVQKLLPVISSILQKILPVIIQIVQKLLPPLMKALGPILDLLGPIFELLDPILGVIVSILDPLADLITNILTPIMALISELIKFLLPPLKAALQFLADLFAGVFKAAVDGVVNAFNTIKSIFERLISFFRDDFGGAWKKIWDSVKQVFTNIWEGIKTAFKIPINWIIDGINVFIKGINKIKIPDWVPLVGGKGFNIKLLPNLENGGILEKGQTGLLEGNGAEAVVPLENNRKWIHAVAEDMKAGGLGGDDKTTTLLEAILALLKELFGLQFYLDGDKLVGGIAERMDEKLGEIAVRKARA